MFGERAAYEVRLSLVGAEMCIGDGVGVDLGVIGMLMIWRAHLVIQQECPYEHSCSMGVEMSGGSFSGVWMSIIDSCLGIFLGGDAMVFGWVGDRLRCSRAWRIALLSVASRCWRMSCGIALAMVAVAYTHLTMPTKRVVSVW